MRDDQMERCARLASAYDPYPNDPNPPDSGGMFDLFPDEQAWLNDPEYQRMQARLAVACGFVACLIFGFLLGRSMP